jgi:outer membrane assembly lipoprotein YfgL
MISYKNKPLAHTVKALPAIFLVASLVACGSGPEKAKPTALTDVTPLVMARQSWTAQIGAVNYPLSVAAADGKVALASDAGQVALLDAANGRELWRVSLDAPVAAGVGQDGQVVALVTRANVLVALQAGKVLWQQKLGAQVFTAPLVAGGRVFVLAADRSVSAFDGQDGRKLWAQQRVTEPLVLRQSGVLLAVDDTLVVGLSGRLAGLNPLNGSARWEVPIASPRGINDLERLVDLVGRVSRQDAVVCARAFQVRIGCVNAQSGKLLWTQAANGMQGLDGDAQFIFGTEADGTVIAWRRDTGEKAWSIDSLRYRQLTAPVVVGRSIAVGDLAGFVHLLARADGSLLNRLPTDGSAIVSTPVLVGNTLIAVTQNGGVFGFQPQ